MGKGTLKALLFGAAATFIGTWAFERWKQNNGGA